MHDKIAKELKRLKIDDDISMKKLLKNLRQVNPLKYSAKKISFSKNVFKFCAFGDAHMGHVNYRPDILRHMAANCKRQKVDFIVNAGDTIEGMSGREGHIYELSYVGKTAQQNYFDKEMRILKDFDVFSIEAQDSHSGWYHNKGNIGVDMGADMANTSPNYKFLGYDEQDLILKGGPIIRLRHPGGGSAYALSYKGQKYIESISGGKKPNICICGHFHKCCYIFYRNIHYFDVGALQEQSPFMRKKGSPSHLGYWIIEVFVGKNRGVERIRPEFVPFYD